MNILAFDSSGNGCSAALLAEDRLLAHRFEAMVRGQAERLVPMIAEVLAESGIDSAAIDLIAVTLGPGAFTGVRIGIAAAQGFALATGKPALGISGFETVAAAVPPALLTGRHLVVALDSRREELYLQSFDADLRPLGPGALVPPEEWRTGLPPGPLLLAGDGAERLMAALHGRDLARAPGDGIPDAADLAHLARHRWHEKPEAARLEPIYLRAPDTTLPKPVPTKAPAP